LIIRCAADDRAESQKRASLYRPEEAAQKMIINIRFRPGQVILADAGMGAGPSGSNAPAPALARSGCQMRACLDDISSHSAAMRRVAEAGPGMPATIATAPGPTAKACFMTFA